VVVSEGTTICVTTDGVATETRVPLTTASLTRHFQVSSCNPLRRANAVVSADNQCRNTVWSEKRS
jgi:hypothetical protein